MRRQVLDGLGRGAADRLVEIASQPLQGAHAAGRAIDALEAQAQTGVHELQQAEVDGRVLLGAVELLEEFDAAGALAEEAHQHAVARPDVAVLGRQVLHDVVGGGGERVFGDLHLIGGRAGRARIALEGLDRLRHLIHQRPGAGARQRGAQTPQGQQQRGGRAHQRIVGHHRKIDRNMRRGRRGRHRRRGGVLRQIGIDDAPDHPGVALVRRRRRWG